MRAKDLRKYKTLDITELSGSPWNDAEKVLGLDQDDKVIMAEPDAVVTPEDVDEAISQAMEAETARTEDTYAKKSEVPDLDDYYTKEEVDEAISGITVDLSDYYTKDETDQAISAATQDLASTDYVDDAIAAIPEPDLSDYYTKGETDGAISTALVPYATKGWVSSQSYANQNYVMFKVNEAMQIETARTESTYAKPSDIPSLDGYATETYVDDAIADIPQVDLSEYAKTTAVTQDIQTAIAAETARTESTYLKEHQSLDNYYTKSQVDAEITGATEGLASEQYVDDAIAAIPPVDLSAYAKTTAVTQDIQTAMAAETARTESTYLKEHQSLDNYYTKSEVDADFVSAATAVGQAIDAAVQGLASETYVDNAVAGLASEEYVDNAVAGIVFPDDYATTGDVANAVEGLASESYVNDAITSATEGMATQSDLEGLASESYVDDAVNGVVQGIGMLGMVNDVSESNGTVTVQKTTMQEGQLVTGSTSFNIATPGDIQTAMASETARTESTYLKEHQSLDNYYTKSQVDAEITGATEDMATKTWVGQQGYLTQHQDISGKLDKTDFNTYTGATETALAEKLDATAYTQGIAAETARTESTYAKKTEIPSLDDYWTSAQTQSAITAATDDMAAELTGRTETIIQTLEVGGDSTGTTLTIHYDNGKNVIDYTYPLKETNAGYLLVYDVSSYFNSSYYSVLSVSDNNTAYYPVTDGDEYIGRPNLVFDLSTTQTGQLKFSYEDYIWLVYNTIDHTLTFTSSLPTWSETVQTTGILDDYWTSAQTQSAITAATQGMVTSGDVATQIGTAMASETARTESTYAKPSQIPSLNGYATEQWVQNQGYLTQHQSLAEYYTKTEIDGMIGDIESLLASI